MKENLFGKVATIPDLLNVEEQAGTYTIEDRLTGLTFKVQKVRGRYVGPCTCTEESELPGAQCSHQAAVRRLLMDRWWYGKDYKRTKL